jgi:hypothetical protein
MKECIDGTPESMTVPIHFNPAEKSCVKRKFLQAQELTSSHFRLDSKEGENTRYEVKTLAQLESHEVNDRVFAHLCKYSFQKQKAPAPLEEGHFYRICLQDNRILDAVSRGGPFIRLEPLLLYIATHELVHILRFDRGESDFDLPEEEREKEEKRVHRITTSILEPFSKSGMNLVLDCFGEEYRIDALYH